MSLNGKLMPNLDQHHKSTKVLNLTVLQRIDPFVEEILITAAHVTLYEFNVDLNQWSRKDVEGSLFVVKRSMQPRFQFIVMNRRNTDNLVENLLGNFEYEVQVPYLLYRNAAQEVNGIWFYNQHDCEAVANLFNRIINAYSKVPQKPKVTSNKSEFEELEAIPSLSVIEGPLEPLTSTAAAPVPDDSFVHFFNAPMNVGNLPNAPKVALQSSATLPFSSLKPSFIPPMPSVQTSPFLPNLTPFPFLDTHESNNTTTNHFSDLVKPSFFSPPSFGLKMTSPAPSSMHIAPPFNPSLTMQGPYGTPLLQPFPPPTPPPSLTPVQNCGQVITRDKVREALLSLVQDDNFINLVYQAMVNAHSTRP